MRPPAPTALLDLPAGAGHTALRAGLMAMRVLPSGLPAARRERDAALGLLGSQPQEVAFIDISADHRANTPSLLELDAMVPRGAGRSRIFLTRLAGGHVSEADRRWVQSLGFADLVPEFDAQDCEGQLRKALDAVAAAQALPSLAPAELARYARVMNAERASDSPRALIRALTGLGAEAFAAQLQQSLAIEDRSYRLQDYPACFIGTEAVAWMASKLKRSAADAVALGQALGALGLLVHVAQEHPFLDDHLFYRLAWSASVDSLDMGSVLAEFSGAHGVAVAQRSHLGTSYPQCWVGSEGVDWLAAHHKLSRLDAWLVLHRLMQFGLIEHVARARPFIDGAFFYRFAGH